MDPVLIVGTGRCGSSLLAAMLDHLGFFMGPDLVPGNHTNPLGHFEDTRFKKLNLALARGQITPDIFAAQAQKYGHDSAEDDRARRGWGFKVPSTAEVLDHYLRVFENPRIIWIQRPQEEVIQSMIESYDWERAQAEAKAQKRQEMCKRHVPSSALEIEMHDLIMRPKKTIHRVCVYLDRDPSTEERDRAAALVRDSRNHGAHVLVAIPNQGWAHMGVLHTAVALSHDPRFRVELQYPSTKHYERNINTLVRDHIRGRDDPPDYLMLMDTDNPPMDQGRKVDPILSNRKNPLDLIELDLDVVSCPTPQSRGDDVYFVIMDDEQPGKDDRGAFEPVPPARRRSLQPIDATGSGMMIIDTEVLLDDRMRGPWKQDFDEDGIPSMTGDFRFCRRARDAGYRIWAQWDYPCDHHKETNQMDRLKMASKVRERAFQHGQKSVSQNGAPVRAEG